MLKSFFPALFYNQTNYFHLSFVSSFLDLGHPLSCNEKAAGTSLVLDKLFSLITGHQGQTNILDPEEKQG
jgi:hypothetical protein